MLGTLCFKYRFVSTLLHLLDSGSHLLFMEVGVCKVTTVRARPMRRPLP